MEESLFMDRVRDLFAMLDRMVYSLISIFYNTIMDLSAAQVINGDTINSITGKIYALIGVFMLFRVSFSLINYIVDPDAISDKAKGGGALIKNIVITFALVIAVPFGFNLLYEAQSAILADQVIPKFIFTNGIEDVQNTDKYTLRMGDCDELVQTADMGDFIGLSIFQPFFTIEKNNTKGLDATMNTWYCSAGNDHSVKSLLSESDLYNAPKGWSTKHNYDINYSFFLSTVVGVVVALLFLSFCFDIAVRMLKLLFYEMIAPIPIIMFIDPKSSKNGMFSKWLKEVITTWASLFLRLVAVFMAIFVIQKVSDGNSLSFLNGYNKMGSTLWLKLLIMIGALIFAKQLPKLIEDILGIKMSGSMTLNPMKKIRDNALGGNVVAGAVTGAVAGSAAVAGGMAANAWAWKKNNMDARKKLKEDGISIGDSRYNAEFKKLGGNNFTGGIGSMFAGGMSSGARAIMTGKDGKFKPLKNAATGITGSSTRRNQRDAGYKFVDQIVDNATDVAKISNDYGTTSAIGGEIKKLQQKLENVKAKEQFYLQQQALLSNNQPEKALAYNDANSFDWKTGADGKQYREYKYSDYEKYNDKFTKDLDEAIAHGDKAKIEEMNIIGVLTEQEFTRARTIELERTRADAEGRKIEKEIKKHQENQRKKDAGKK